MFFKMAPASKDYVWGDGRLARMPTKHYPFKRVAESWELSCHPAGLSVIADKPYTGIPLRDYIRQDNLMLLGENCAGSGDFPILVKLIDARENLSVQVHPDDAYAWKHENQPGKTEMWHILYCEPGATLYLGLRQEVSPAELREAVEPGHLEQLLRKVPVAPGDTFLIRHGTIHAIGSGILLVEVQESSDVTYRLYDYGRPGKDGKPRPLHIDKALDVVRLVPGDEGIPLPFPVATDYFVADRFEVQSKKEICVDNDSFAAMVILSGQGTLSGNDGTRRFYSLDTLFIEAGAGKLTLEGECAVMIITVPERNGVIWHPNTPYLSVPACIGRID